MIIVEERLTEAFDQLPMIDGFKPVYDWGNSFNLIAVLKSYEENKTSPYPLIYQTSNESIQDINRSICQARLTFVVACQNKNTELLNKNRWAMSYRNVLYPTILNMEKVFRNGSIFNWDEKYKMTNYPNYGSGTANFTADIWDAVEVEFANPININNDCINQIRF